MSSGGSSNPSLLQPPLSLPLPLLLPLSLPPLFLHEPLHPPHHVLVPSYSQRPRFSSMGDVLQTYAPHRSAVLLIDVANAPSGLRMILSDAQVQSKMAAGQLKVECFVRCDSACYNVGEQRCEVEQLAQAQLAQGNVVEVVYSSIAHFGPEADDQALVDAAEHFLAQDDAPFVVVLSADRFRHALSGAQRGVLDGIRDGKRGVQVTWRHKRFETISPVRDGEKHVAIKAGGLGKRKGAPHDEVVPPPHPLFLPAPSPPPPPSFAVPVMTAAAAAVLTLGFARMHGLPSSFSRTGKTRKVGRTRAGRVGKARKADKARRTGKARTTKTKGVLAMSAAAAATVTLSFARLYPVAAWSTRPYDSG